MLLSNQKKKAGEIISSSQKCPVTCQPQTISVRQPNLIFQIIIVCNHKKMYIMCRIRKYEPFENMNMEIGRVIGRVKFLFSSKKYEALKNH